MKLSMDINQIKYSLSLSIRSYYNNIDINILYNLSINASESFYLILLFVNIFFLD